MGKNFNLKINQLKDYLGKISTPACIVKGAELVMVGKHLADITNWEENANIFSLIFDDDHQIVAVNNHDIFNTIDTFYIENKFGKLQKVSISTVPLFGYDSYYLFIFNLLSDDDAFYFRIFDSSPVGIICLDQQMEILKINRKASVLFNGTPKTGTKLQLYFTETPFNIVKDKLEKVFITGKADISQLNISNSNKDPVICKLFYKRSNFKNKKCVFLFILDITQEKLTEHKLSKEKEKVETTNLKLKESIEEAKVLTEEVSYANKSKSAFIANISHEIRTPLNAIMGFSEILSRDITNQAHLQYLESIIQSGNALLEIINSILDYSKLAAGKRSVHNQEINIRKFFSNLARVYRDLALEKGIKFKLDISKDLPSHLMLDKQLVSQILRNLLDNAVKFTESGRVELRIAFKQEQKNKIVLLITVSDTGIGIPLEEQEKIFSPFSQRDNQRHAEYGGTGLGLSILQKSVELVSGQLDMKSKPGKGTSFFIKLPSIKVLDRRSEVNEILLDSIDIKKVHFKNQKILIAENTKFTKILIQNILAEYHLDLMETEDLKETIAILRRKALDLLVIDNNLLKNIFKRHVAQQFDKIIRKKEIPVVVIVHKVEADKELLIDYDKLVPVEKPIKEASLIKALTQYLEFETAAITTTQVSKNMPIIPDNMPPERINRMVNFMRLEFLPKCKKIKENFILSEVEELTQQVNDIAENNNIWILNDWIKEMQQALNNFEIHKIKKQIARFPDIIKEISLILEKKRVN